MPKLFSQHRVVRDLLYLGCLIVAMSLMLIALTLDARNMAAYLFPVYAFGAGTGFVGASAFVEGRLQQFERMANKP